MYPREASFFFSFINNLLQYIQKLKGTQKSTSGLFQQPRFHRSYPKDFLNTESKIVLPLPEAMTYSGSNHHSEIHIDQ
jgi:hypothetical protein